MTIKDLGFLSPEFAKHINLFRQKHSIWFCLSDRLNQLGQTALTSTHAPREDNQKLLVAVLLIRLVSAFQAAIILAERGMATEARYVLRSMLELVFALAAAARDPEFPRKYGLKAMRHQKTIANVLLQLPDDYKPNEMFDETKIREKAAEFKAELDAAGEPSLSVEAIAKIADLSGHYDTAYRDLSATSHALVTDLDIHAGLGKDGEIERLHWGPNPDRIPDVLLMACEFLMLGLHYDINLFALNELEAPYGECWQEMKRLIEMMPTGSSSPAENVHT